MAKAIIDASRCKGCGLCTAACPKQLITMGTVLNESGYFPAELKDTEACIGCKMCAISCPDVAITIVK